MGHWQRFFVAAVGALSLLGAGAVSVGAHEDGTVIEFDSMTGIPAGHPSARTIPGGGLPWVIKSGHGEVDRDGHVRVRVRGLVIPVAPFNGTNPAHTFGVVVSCITSSGTIMNVHTRQFAATTTGNARIRDKVSLPNPCLQPIVFVIGPNGAWFAMSNAEDDD